MADLSVRRNAGSGLASRRREFDPFEQMRELMGWDPLEALGTFAGRQGMTGFVPSFDVKETKDSFIFKADLPGVKEDDVEISLTGDRLTITGKREEEQREQNERFYAYERSFGTFSRSFTLPDGVSADDVQAQMKDGVLSVLLPKKPEVQPKRIRLGGTGEKKGKA